MQLLQARSETSHILYIFQRLIDIHVYIFRLPVVEMQIMSSGRSLDVYTYFSQTLCSHTHTMLLKNGHAYMTGPMYTLTLYLIIQLDNN